MKKRLFSILLALCMVLCLVPTTAFAESETEEPPVCSCETACTTDNMNKECPVCGAENAIPQNCGQYIPVEDRTGENGSTERADDPNGPTELSAADQVQAMIDGLPNAEEITLTYPARTFPAQQTAETQMVRFLCRIRRCTMFPLPMWER